MKVLLIIVTTLSLAACELANVHPNSNIIEENSFFEFKNSVTHNDLINLPEPKGKIIISTYNFIDQSGQYKDSPYNSFSTALPQGIDMLLDEALINSKWFIPVERRNFQNLLTERKIMQSASKGTIRELAPSNIIIDGGIISYDTNTQSGGNGFRYLGIGPSSQFRLDKVTIALRMIDVSSGEIMDSVLSTKSIYSKEVKFGIFKFVRYKELLELETGYTRNKPLTLCINAAIEHAVIRLVLRGIKRNKWFIKGNKELNSLLVNRYLTTPL